MVAKETAHFSLVACGSAALFLWALLRTLDTKRTRDAILVGALVAVASYSDAYYGIYCAIMGGFLLAWRFVRVQWRGRAAALAGLTRTVNVAIVCGAALIVWRLVSGITQVRIGSLVIGLQMFHTPVLILLTAVALRAWLRWRPVPRLDPEARPSGALAVGLVAIGVCFALLSPLLIGLIFRFMDGRLPAPKSTGAAVRAASTHSRIWCRIRITPGLAPARGSGSCQASRTRFPNSSPHSRLRRTGDCRGAWRRMLPRLWIAFNRVLHRLSLGHSCTLPVSTLT